MNNQQMIYINGAEIKNADLPSILFDIYRHGEKIAKIDYHTTEKNEIIKIYLSNYINLK